MPDIKLFAGNATPELAKRISERLYTSLGDARSEEHTSELQSPG